MTKLKETPKPNKSKKSSSPNENRENLSSAEQSYQIRVVEKKLHVVDIETGKTIHILNKLEDLKLFGVSLEEAEPSCCCLIISLY